MKKQINALKALESCLKYYDMNCEEYHDNYQDELSEKPYDQEFLNRFNNLLKEDARILDVGCCSTAQQARFFHDMGFKVTSIDLSAKCIEMARQNYKGIDFQIMDMCELNFEDAAFDAIIAFYSIIHIPDDQLDNLFAGFNRVLKRQGKLGISVHTGDFYGYYKETEIPVFYRTYTQSELRELLQKWGFHILEIDQRKPIYDFEFQSERIYLIAEKTD